MNFSTTLCSPFFTSITFSIGKTISCIKSVIPEDSLKSSKAFFTFFS
ncbi:hypothetical protein CP8484711_1662A, partial [Chlamydia psittaci 84-8471/1]